MSDEIDAVRGTSLDAIKLKLQAQEAKHETAALIREQAASKSAMLETAEQAQEFNPLQMGKKFKEIEKRAANEEAIDQEQEQVSPEEAKKIAQEFNKKNPELNPKALLNIKSNIFPGDSLDSILSKVRHSYPDPSLADEVLDFLLETTPENTALKQKLGATKEQFNEVFGREIRAGKNIQNQALEFSKQGLGSTTALRDLYRDITGNPRTAPQLFDELSSKFAYTNMKKIIDFVLHSLGNDLKAKGPSIPRPELMRLADEARNMQAILGVFRFFRKRMGLIASEFSRADLTMPTLLNFQQLAKLFMKLIGERYPSPGRVFQLASMLGVSEEVAAQIIIFAQYRDAMRNVSPKLFKSERHRQDLLTTMLEALTQLEDELEEEEDDEDEEEEDS